MFQRKSDGMWVERVPVPWRKSPVTLYAKTKAALKIKLRDFEAEQDLGLTVDDALDLWLAKKEKDVSYKTYEGYQAPVKRIREAFGKDRVSDVTPDQVQAFINSIADKGYKRTTVQRPLDVMRMLFDFLITMPGSRIRLNPCNGVRMPKGLHQENRDLAPREAVEIVLKNISHPFGLYPFFIMYTGLRDGEALAITDKDIHDGKIFVSRSVSWQPNQPVLKEPKTENGVREVVLLSPLAAVLPKFKGYLFSADNGKSPLTQSEFRRRWNGYCRDVGLAVPEVQIHKSKGQNNRTYKKTIWHNTIVPYQLRHEFATFCFDAELDPKDAAYLMGHSNEEITRKWYTHIQNARKENTAVKLERYIKEYSTSEDADGS